MRDRDHWPGGAGGPTWRRLARGDLSWGTFRARSRLLAGIRAFFRVRGFLEVDTPIAQEAPNLDPNVYPVRISGPDGRPGRFFLHTSPELAMKKLLAAGSGNIFYLGKVFRDREGSPLHHPEFTMLEWYRVDEGAGAVMGDVEALVRSMAREVTGRDSLRRGGRTIPLADPWARWELADAFATLVGAPPTGEDPLRAALASKGARPGPGETWADLFFRAYVDFVEPAMGEKGACFLTGFPAPLAAMARRRQGDRSLCERFEGYLGGIELVNGYEELTDAGEQEERLRDLVDAHRRAGENGLFVDRDFLDALRHGLPRCSGAALGVDRLAMLLLGKDAVADVIYR